MDTRDDILFGKIALNKRLIRRDLLNRALQYQRSQAPFKPLGEILLEKGILTRQQVDEILAFQNKVKQIKISQSGQAFDSSSVPGSGRFPGPQPGGGYPSPPPPPGPGTGHWGPGASGGGFSQPGFSQPNFSQPGAQPGMPGIATATGSTPNPEQDPLLGAVIGGCTIHQKIGAGGMGAIYLAHHEALRKEVVVKILPPESAANPRTVERFFREARAAAKLEHPNIVQVQDVGTTDRGLHFIIMQYIDGRNLEQKIQEDGRHTPLDAVRIVNQVAQGLRAAHATGVIHRDIKAENILITPGGVVKLTDFGLAKDLNSELKLTADGAMIGTPLYMAPEIGRVKEIDGRVDIYSLGVTFYYLLTGIQPFRGFSALEILSAKAHDKLKPPETIVPELPDTHRRVLGKMLEKDRDSRYESVDALIRELDALDRNLPIEAPQPSVWPPRADGDAQQTVEAPVTGAKPKTKKTSQRANRLSDRVARPPAKKMSPRMIALLGLLVVVIFGLAAALLWILIGS